MRQTCIDKEPNILPQPARLECGNNRGVRLIPRKRDFAAPFRATSMKAGLLGLLMAAAISLALPVHAVPFTQSLDFVAADSLWGPGGATGGFSKSGSTSFSVLGVGIGLGYSIGASSGTAAAQFKGDMSVDYTPSLSLPGSTTINLGFQGNAAGGQLKSDLGAQAQMWAGPISVGPNFLLGIDQGYTPQLDQAVTGSDSATAATINLLELPPFLPVAKAGVDMDVAQTDHFMATAIDGWLNYSLRGSGVASAMPFSLATDAGLSLDVDLGAKGIWDFWFVDQELINEFSTSLAMELVLFEEHYSSHDTCGVWPFEWPCDFYWDRNDTTLASINVYDGVPFALDFNRITNTNGFSIQVGTTQVPEPATLGLLGLGFAGLGWARRRQRG